MRKINLENYITKGKVPDRMNPGQLIDIEFPYQVKDSIMNIMFDKELRLSGADLIKQEMVAMKIEACKESTILLEDEEYKRVKGAFDKCTGFTRTEVELVKRINEAEVVEVEQK